MSRDEECIIWYRQTWEAADYDREAACRRADCEDEEEGEDVEGSVVVSYSGIAAAFRFLRSPVILSAADLGVEEGNREICDI